MPIGIQRVFTCKKCGKTVIVTIGDNLNPFDIMKISAGICDECRLKEKERLK